MHVVIGCTGKPAECNDGFCFNISIGQCQLRSQLVIASVHTAGHDSYDAIQCSYFYDKLSVFLEVWRLKINNSYLHSQVDSAQMNVASEIIIHLVVS